MTSDPSTLLSELVGKLQPVDTEAGAAAAEYHLQLTKPPGALGRVESLGVQLSAIAGSTLPPAPAPAAVAIFAADHGVLSEGVSPWPQEVTAQMVGNFCGGGAGINAIAQANGIDVVVVNAGVATALPDHPQLVNTPVRLGSDNIRRGPAMSVDEAAQSVALGIETARQLVAGGTRCLLTGDMGIGNTTASTATIGVAVGLDAEAITGRGTGIDDEVLALKTTVIAEVLERARSIDPSDGLALLAEVGGLEIGGIAGLCLGAAEARIPVIIDGVIALAGAVVADRLSPLVRGYMIAGHRSVEPAATVALSHLELDPILELDLRLGEGTGAALAHPIVVAAAAVMNDMATFADVGITDG